MNLEREKEKLTDVSMESTDPGEELDDIQWLKVKYGKVLDRERNLLEYLMKILGDFDYRIKALEKKFEKS